MSVASTMSADNVVPDLEEKILIPYTHIRQVASKGTRNRIAEAFNFWLRVPQEKMKEIVNIMDMCHNGSLLLDDIQDDVTVRRGIPAAHCVYGIPWTSNASIHIIMLVMEKCMHMGHEATKVFTEQGLEIARGQGKEIYWRDMLICPTEAEFKRMTEQKTGAMLNIGVRLMQLFSENSTDYSELVKKFGFFFQLIDDYYNIESPEKLEERPAAVVLQDYYMDLTEGKFTIPLIHALRTSKGDAILSILKQRTTDITLKRYCVSLLQSLGSLEYTKNLIRELEANLRSEIRLLGGNHLLEAVLDKLQI